MFTSESEAYPLSWPVSHDLHDLQPQLEKRRSDTYPFACVLEALTMQRPQNASKATVFVTVSEGFLAPRTTAQRSPTSPPHFFLGYYRAELLSRAHHWNPTKGLRPPRSELRNPGCRPRSPKGDHVRGCKQLAAPEI